MNNKAENGSSQGPNQNVAESITGGRLSIETLQEKDIEQFHEMMLSVIRGTDDALSDDSEIRTKKYYQEAVSNPREWTLLAAKDDSGQIIGGLEARIVPYEKELLGYVQWICVIPDVRRRRIAEKLYNEYELSLRERGDVSKMGAYVADNNTTSLGLHRKIGMTNVLYPHRAGKRYYKNLLKLT